MIKLMLGDRKIICNISKDSPCDLMSASLLPNKNRAYVHKSGSSAVCCRSDDSDEYILIEDCPLLDALELIQSIFDFLNDWELQAISYIHSSQWDELLSSVDAIVKKPLVIFSEYLFVIAMSKQYSYGSVDDEWDYLLSFGVSSSSTYREGRSHHNLIAALENENGMFSYASPDPNKTSFFSASIVRDNNILGYFSSVSVDSRFTPGETQVLHHIANLISTHAPFDSALNAVLSNSSTDKQGNSIFKALLLNPVSISIEALTRYLSYLSWTPESMYQVYGITVSASAVEDTLQNIRMVFSNSSITPCVIIDSILVFIVNKSHFSASSDLIKIGLLAERFNGAILSSLTFNTIMDAQYGLSQIKYLKANIKDTLPEYSFYDYALDYIIKTSDPGSLLRACHPGIVTLCFDHSRKHELFAEALAAYLYSNHSIAKASQYLGIHKNTLTYRLNKALEISKLNLDSNYDREYARLSLRIFKLF